MTVQATIALLNKNAHTATRATSYATTAAGTTMVMPCTSKSARLNPTWKDVGSKQRRSSSDKSSTAVELERIRSSSNGGVASILSKFDCPETTPSRKTTVQASSSNNNNAFQAIRHSDRSSRIDAIMDDLSEMYKCATEEARRAKNDCQSMSANFRDYEAQIQHLNKQLDEVSHERNELKVQLSMFQGSETEEKRCRCPQQEINGSITALTRWATEEGNSEKKATTTTILDTGPTNDIVSSSDELLFVKKQLTALEKGTQTVFEKQAKDLETERKQTRTLTEVVHKQEKLIMVLELKLSSSRFDKDHLLLLQDQVELLQLELDDKCNLLSRLLEERDSHFHPTTSVHSQASSCMPTAECATIGRYSTSSRASTPSLQTSSTRSSYINSGLLSLGRSTPPFTSPPRDPLPPLPHSMTAATAAARHASRDSYASSSLSSTSFLSPSTSWSSAEYALMRSVDKTIVSTPFADGEHQQWADCMPVHIAPTPSRTVCRQPSSKFTLKRHSSNHNGTAFWKGWKHRLSARQ